MALGIPLSRSHQAFAGLLARFHKKFLTFRSALVGARFDTTRAVADFRKGQVGVMTARWGQRVGMAAP